MQECTHEVPQDRKDLGYDYCVECAKSRPLPRAEYIVMGQHKGQPLVFAVDDPIVQRHESLYNRG